MAKDREKTQSKTAPVEDLPLLSRFDSRTCDSQLRNYARGCMGPKEHRTPAGTKTKRNLWSPQLTLARPSATSTAAFSYFIPSSHHSSHDLPRSLLCGCFKHNINGVWEAGGPQTSFLFSLLHWSCHHSDADFSKWLPQVCWKDPHNASVERWSSAFTPRGESIKTLLTLQNNIGTAPVVSDVW